MRKWILIVGVLLWVASIPSLAQSFGDSTGIVPAGASATDIRDAVVLNWKGTNCSVTGNNCSTFTATEGPCDWRRVVIYYTVPSGTLSVEHAFNLEVSCNGTELEADFSFCPTPGPCTSSDADNGTFEFSELVITSYETALPDISDSGVPFTGAVPTLGQWGAILLGLAVLGGGVFLIVRHVG